MKKRLRTLWCISFAFLLSACGGQENDFSNTVIGNNADYVVPSREVTAIDPGEGPVARVVPSSLITVPYRAHDLAIPHPAYNGHPTTFKAISRGVCENVYYRWDINGDGTWDSCDGRSFSVSGANGQWYLDNRYRLDCRKQLPYTDPTVSKRKLFLAMVEATCSVDGSGSPEGSRFATYKVMVFADAPVAYSSLHPSYNTYRYNARPPVTQATCSGGTCAETGFPCSNNAECVGDTPETLNIKREVAIDDALWFLHKNLNRTGEGLNTISGYFTNSMGADYIRTDTAEFLRGLALNGHTAAYPPATYIHDPSEYPDVQPLPDDWTSKNDARYNTDPYAEDATRCINYLLNQLYSISVSSSAEVNDGLTPIPGTDDEKGYYLSQTDLMGRLIAALADSGMAGTSMQVGGVGAHGHSMEWMVQQLVDALVYYQFKSGSYHGGWSFTTASGAAYGHATHAAIMGLTAAERAMGAYGVIVPKEGKNRVANYLATHQSPNGSGQYALAYPGNDLHYSGGALVFGHGWLGVNTLPNDANQSFSPQSTYTNAQLLTGYNNAMTFLANNWNCNNASSVNWAHCNWAYPNARFDGAQQGATYTHALISGGLSAVSPVPSLVGTYDWRADYSYYLINNQEKEGSTRQRYANWTSMGLNYASIYHNTGMVIVTGASLIRKSYGEKPTAVGAATPSTAVEGCAGGTNGKITFSHSGSYHADPGLSILDYQWIFDTVASPTDTNFGSYNWAGMANGAYSADGKAFHTTSKDATPVYTYLSSGTYYAALRVVDNDSPTQTNIFVITLVITDQPEYAPVADPGGPYVIYEGGELALDGSNSSDPNQSCGDSIVSYSWDLDGDGSFDDCATATCALNWAEVAALGWPIDDPVGSVVLRVEDSTGLTHDATTTLRLLSVCGDTIVSGDEQCDDGNTENGDCCAFDCTFETIGTLCGDGPTVCSGQDTCDGSGLCLPNHLPETNLCGDEEGPCVNQDTCDGDGACHDNGFKPSGTPCTSDALFCTGAETCDNGGSCLSEGDPCSVDLFCDEDIDACINSREEPCDTDNGNPSNSQDIIANVTIIYSTAGGWTAPAACAWVCDTDFAEEGGACINQKDVQCDDTTNPVNSTNTIANVTIHYTTDGGWESPVACEWECDTDFAEEGGACINQKDVQCDEDNTNPVNSSDIIANVTITYTTAGGWELPADCAWECDIDFLLKDGIECVECLGDGDCADGNACNGEELCDDLGLCNAGIPLVCADENACTDNSCDPAIGCMIVNNTDTCDDTNPLTENDICGDGACAGTLMSGVCGNAIPVGALPYTTTGTTAGRPSALTLYGDACVADSQPTGDIVYELTVEEGVEYQIQVVPTDGGDLALNLLGACGAGEECIDAANTGGAGETGVLIGTAAQSGTLYIAIEGSGEYELSIAVVEQPDEDTIEPTDDTQPDETLVDEIVIDGEEPDETVIDDVVSDEVTTDEVVTDDIATDTVVTDDDSAQPDETTDETTTDTDTVQPDKVTPDTDTAKPDTTTDKDTVATDDEQPDETSDEFLSDEDTVIVPDTNKVSETGCGCSLVF